MHALAYVKKFLYLCALFGILVHIIAMKTSKKYIFTSIAMLVLALLICAPANASFTLKHRMGIVELPAGERQDALFLKTGQQVVHTDSIIMYAASNEGVNLPRPDKKAYTTYVRWYNYDTDDAIALVDRYTAAGDTAKRCNINNAQGKFRIGYLNKEYSFETKYTTYPGDRVIRIAADQSAYANYTWTIDGEDTTFIEPTLSRRRIYVFRPAREMAQKVYDCTNNDNYLEVHKMMAPTGRQLYLGPDYAIIDKNLTHGNYYYLNNNSPTGAPKRMSVVGQWSWKIGEDGEKVYLNGNSTIDENTIINGQYKSASSNEPGTITYYLQYTNGDYTYNIAKFIVEYVTASNIGPSTSVSSPEPTSKMELLYEQNFNFNRPGTTSPDVQDGGQPTYYTDGHLPVNESSYGCFYQDIAFFGGPSAGIRPNKANKDLTSGEYGICNWQDFYNQHKYIYNHVEGHTNSKEDAREGYFLYVDGSDLQGEVFSLEVNVDLCPGSTMYFYSWLIDGSHNGSTRSAPNMDFIVIGEDTAGIEHILTTYTTGEFGVNASANSDNSASSRGVWYQVMFPVTIDENHRYPRYELKIMNKGRTNDGNDFAIDDIRIYVQKPPVMPLQASTAECVDQAIDTITAYLRVDYKEIDYTGNSLFFQWRDAKDSSILIANYYNMDSIDHKSTVFGRVPVKQDSEIDLEKDTCSSLLSFDSKFHATDTTVIRYIEEKINLTTTRFVMYIAMPIEVRPNYTYTGFVSPLADHLGRRDSTGCGTYADLLVSGGTRITINDEITTEETVHVCGHRTYDLNIVLTQVVQDLTTENLKVDTFRCKADWLVGGPDYVNAHPEIYLHTFSEIQDYLGFYHQNPNHPVAKAPIEYLMREGLLFLDTFGISMTPELALSYTAFPRGKVQMPDGLKDVCSVPRFLHIQPADPASNMMVVGKDASEYAGLPDVVKNRPRIIRISDAQRREGWFNVPLYRIGEEESYIIDRVYAISSTDPNWRSVALVSDHDEMLVKDTIYLGNKEDHNDPINVAIQSLKPGYDYTFHVAFVGESDEDRCDRGHTYFTLRVVPDMVTWTGGDWNRDASWNHFIPMDTTNVILQAQDYKVTFAEEHAESFDVNYTRNKCRNIYLPAGSSMAGQENLVINGTAYVDIPVPAQKWALTSIPIKGIVSGDLFVSQNEDDNPFTVAGINHSGTGEPALDRYTYEVYDSPYDATENKWSRPDSILDRPIRPNDAIMIGIDCESASPSPVIRLPKPDNMYHYYDISEHNWLDASETIGESLRADLGKPAWNGESTITIRRAYGNLYEFGNPTFGYIDLTQLVADNTETLSGKYYMAPDDINALPGTMDLATINPSAAHVLLPPFKGVLLEGKTESTELEINLTEEARVSAPASAPIRRALQYASGSLDFGDGVPIGAIRTTAPVVISETDTDIYDKLAENSTIQTLNLNRTLVRNGKFNTLCLPFSMSAAEIDASPLTGAEIFEYLSAEKTGSGLNIYMSQVENITAGVPYLVKWDPTEPETIPMPLVFRDVHITALMGDTIGASDEIRFAGNIPIGLVQEGNENHLFLGANNTLYWPQGDSRLRGFRAHFRIPTVGPAAAPKNTPARIVLQKQTPTGVESIQSSAVSVQKIVKDGQVIILRNGKKYDVTGKEL